MWNPGWLRVCAVALTLAGSPARAGDELAARIDRRMAGAAASPAVDDATFLRRASLDLIGRIPTQAEARAFLDSNDPGRRGRLVETLMASPSSARASATFWRRLWIPQGDAQGLEHLADELEAWLSGRLRRGDRLDRLARDLIVGSDLPAIGGRGAAPAGFLLANELKAENLAGNAARAFLGLNLACAQCHDHPFADWTRDQFWELAAFYAPPRPGVRPSIRVADTARTVEARTPDGADLRWPDGGVERPEQARDILARWVASAENPWFARQAMNQLWGRFLGTPLVGPFDDPEARNPPPNAALLDELAGAFSASGFDVDRMTRAIVLSRTYQSTTAPARSLGGEPLFDSLRTAMGSPPPRDDAEAAGLRRERHRFANAFLVARPTADARTVLQSLTVMNGDLASAATAPETSPTLVALASPRFRDEDRVESLFLATLARRPSDPERRAMVAHLSKGGADGTPASALADVFWVLINTSEFHTNH